MIKNVNYNEYIYGEYEEDIRNYIDQYKKEEYNQIIKKDKRTNIVNVFSENRANIIKWYCFNKNKKVLEIGANYGEITQELIEKCENVTAIEFSKEKIEYISKRLEDAQNLKLILCTNLTELELEEKYDYITLIGTGEYAKKLGFKDLSEMIKWAYKYLVDDGKIFLAIDNKFGVKYLAGSTRNKEEEPFANYKTHIKKEYQLYGKTELENIIKKSGFESYKFYYPVPDYNLTQLIYTDSFLPKQNRYNIYYREHEEILFNELSLIQETIKNEKFDFFTNSYLIELSKKETSNICFVNYSNMRKKEYKIMTKLTTDKVTKEAYRDEGSFHIQQIEKNIKKLKELGFNVCEEKQDEKIVSKYISITTMDEHLQKILEQGNIQEFYQELDKWYEFIKNRIPETKEEKNILKKYGIEITEKQKSKLTFLKNGFIDLVFQNVFYDGEEYILFDQEWYEENVPLEFIMYRAIKQLIFHHDELKEKINIQEMYQKYNISEYIGIFEKLEIEWQKDMVDMEILSFYSEKWKRIISIEDIKFRYNQELGKVYSEKVKLQEEKDKLQEEKDKLQEEKVKIQEERDKLKEELQQMKNGSRFYRLMKFFDRRNEKNE